MVSTRNSNARAECVSTKAGGVLQGKDIIRNLGDEKLSRLRRGKGRAFQAEGIVWSSPRVVRSLALLRTRKRPRVTVGQRVKRGVQWRVVLPSPQMAGSAGKEWGGDEGLGIGECLSVLRGPQPLALTPSLLFTELLAAKKTHTCE